MVGLASWYGGDFHGKRTSSKEIYNMYDLTAAHRTLPFGTYVIVTNLQNGKSVTVRINDRGPFVKGRIIDLSYAAARLLDMIGCGIVPVRIDVLQDTSFKKQKQEYSVQVGAFILKKNAQNLKKDLSSKYMGVYLSIFDTSLYRYYRVRIKARDLNHAQEIAERLIKDGYPVLILEEQ